LPGGCFVAAPVVASERGLRALAAIVSEDRDDLPPEGLPPSLLADLTSQIRCDTIAFIHLDSGRQKSTILQAGDAGVLPGGRPFLVWPTSWTRRTGPTTGTARSVVTLTAPVICAAC
jgi:hypothetical protein